MEAICLIRGHTYNADLVCIACGDKANTKNPDPYQKEGLKYVDVQPAPTDAPEPSSRDKIKEGE